ncbi:hypothetical protein H6P81_003114 [Aristolochia fimbriata]|uniref:Amidase domain-containing protein n=1 Tax=Aristolochia fimbriata TaxID=158543 RepID=A0AAV7FEV1_ARIFI|nr:hypothetical protein H6P81_003114 [Aristolochia fimbriata]
MTKKGMPSAATNLWVLLGLGIAGIIFITRKLKKTVREDFGAFVERLQLLPPPQPAPPKAPHLLAGLAFAVADAFDIEGYVTGFGDPEWSRTHENASQTSLAVSVVVEGGATCVGKTVITEMGYSIFGGDKHYEAPTNPVAPARICGGSSSGSAVAVAAELVDFSLGIDSIGGVRVPAACCGVLGFRPSHGAITNTGVIPVSPSLDTIGWFAKDPSVLRRVGHVILQLGYAESRPRHVIIADDCFQLLKIPKARVTQVVIKSTEKLFGKQVLSHTNIGDYMASKVPSLKHFHNKKKNGELRVSSLKSLSNAMQLLHRHEFKSHHEEWINSTKPIVDPVVSACMKTDELLEASISSCQKIRNEARFALNSLLKDDGILVIPTLADLPPKVGAKEAFSEEYQTRALSLLAIVSMSGCCQVTLPLGSHDKCPISVSFIARHGGDRFLLDTVKAMFATLQEQVDVVSKSDLSNNAISQEESAEIAKEKGNNAFKERQWQKAVSFYSEAIKLSGKNATYYSNRAAAYLGLGSFLQAEADCSAAINLDTKNVKAYLRRGTAREMLGYYKEAIEDFRYALVLEPTNKTATLAVNRLKLF